MYQRSTFDRYCLISVRHCVRLFVHSDQLYSKFKAINYLLKKMATENPAKFINSLFLKDFVETKYSETDVKILSYNVEPINPKNFNDPIGRIQRILVR